MADVEREEKKTEVELSILKEDICKEEESFPKRPSLITSICNCCIKVTQSPWLYYVSTLVVLIDLVTLFFYKPCKEIYIYQQVLEYLTFTFLLLEMLIMMMAQGPFGHQGSYLSNNWNKLDIFIFALQILDYSLKSFGSPYHVSYPLRPMRLIRRIACVRDFAARLFKSALISAKAILLCMFVIYVFGIAGVQLWKGELRNRCFLREDIQEKYNASLTPYYISKYGENKPFVCSTNKYGMQCSDVPPYNKQEKPCLLPFPHPDSSVLTFNGSSQDNCTNWSVYYNVCQAGQDNPGMGNVNFDNIGYSWLTMFTVVLLEGWTEIMLFVMDANGFWNCIFFIFITTVGSFIMMNVCTAFVIYEYTEQLKGKPVESSTRAGSNAELLRTIEIYMRRFFHTSMRFWNNKVHPIGGQSTQERHSILKLACMSLKKRLSTIVKSKTFSNIVVFLLFIYVIIFAMERHEQSLQLTKVIKFSSIAFNIFFLVEMFIKIFVLNWKYFTDLKNIFEFLTLIMSILEMFGATGNLEISRLLWFVRLVSSLPWFEDMQQILIKAIKEAGPVIILLVLVILMFSLLGMQLFGCSIITNGKNFNNLHLAMVTVFQILTLEDWNFFLYNTMTTTSPWAALYFIAIIVFGRLFLLNLLIIIAFEGFQCKIIQPELLKSISNLPQEKDDTFSDPDRPKRGPSRPGEDIALSSFRSNGSCVTEEGCVTLHTNEHKTTFKRKVVNWCKEHEEWSLFLFSPTNRVRTFFLHLISHPRFDCAILVLTFLSCITMLLERPGLNPESTERLVLYVVDCMFSGVFLLEVLMKILACGLLFGQDSYCTSRWNVWNGIYVILFTSCTVVSLAMYHRYHGQAILKFFQLLCVFRPLRIIMQVSTLKVAAEAIVASLKPLRKIVTICILFFIFYCILGMQLFKGTFFHCDAKDTKNITNEMECLSANYTWVHKTYNFDSLEQAMLPVFGMFTMDGWVNLMHDGIDAVGVDQQPQKNNNQWMILFFVSFIILSLVLFDIMAGIIMDTFIEFMNSKKKRKENGKGIQFEDKRDESVQNLYNENSSRIWLFLYSLCNSKAMDLVVTVGMLFSVIIMSVEHYNQPKYIEQLLDISFFVFTALLIFEFLVKLLVFVKWRFITLSWNLMDFAVLLVSIIIIIINSMIATHRIAFNPFILRACHILKLAHVLKVGKIRVLMETVIKTLSKVGDICLLFMVFFSIYAALGVELFGNLECTEEYPCQGLNKHVNFKHFGMALITLYQLCTGDNWTWIMKDMLRECPQHNPEACLSYIKWAGPIYLISFWVLTQVFLANLLLAAVTQAMKDSLEMAAHPESGSAGGFFR